MPINKRRVALSLAFACMIALPICTGSLKSFVKQPVETYSEIVENKERQFLETHGADEYSCFFDKDEGKPLTDLCRRAASIQNVYQQKQSYTHLAALLRDIGVGFSLPFLAVFAVPWLAKTYLRWLTSENSN